MITLRTAHVGLGHGGVDAVRFELVDSPGAGEEAAVILDLLEVDDEGAGERRFGEDHADRPCMDFHSRTIVTSSSSTDERGIGSSWATGAVVVAYSTSPTGR